MSRKMVIINFFTAIFNMLFFFYFLNQENWFCFISLIGCICGIIAILQNIDDI